MTRKRKKKSGKNKISNLTNTILSILKKERNKSFNYKQIAAIIGVNDASSRNQIIKTLAKLAAKQEIEQVDRGKFKAVVTAEYHTGILDLASKGNGYVISDDFEEDVFIASNNINKALDGDEVEFYAYKRRKRGKIEGEITNNEVKNNDSISLKESMSEINKNGSGLIVVINYQESSHILSNYIDGNNIWNEDVLNRLVRKKLVFHF